jgi:hypothetical protein
MLKCPFLPLKFVGEFVADSSNLEEVNARGWADES